MGTANRKASGKIAAASAAAKKCGVNPISSRWLTPGATVYMASSGLTPICGVESGTVIDHPSAVRTTGGRFVLTVRVRCKLPGSETYIRSVSHADAFKDEPSAANAIAARLRRHAAKLIEQAGALEEFAETYIPPEDK